MATATRLTTRSIIMKPIEMEVPDGVSLKLTDSEAETLRIIFQWIGGHPKSTRRGDTDAINNALYDAGIKLPSEDELVSDHCKGLTFKTREIPF